MKKAEYRIPSALPLIFISFFLLLFEGKLVYGMPTSKVSDSDKAQIIKSALRKTITKEDKQQAKNIELVLKEEVAPELLTDIGLGLSLIEEEQAEKRLMTKEGIRYYSVRKLEFNGRRVIVDIEYKSGSKNGHSGSVTTYEYKKIAGRWRGKLTGQVSYCAASRSDN